MGSVLIVGEYSGIGKAFYKALQLNGLDVDHVYLQDGYKGIGEMSLIEFISNMAKKKYYDYGIIFSPLTMRLLIPSKYLNSVLRKKCRKLVFVPCTSDPLWLRGADTWRSRRNPQLGFLLDAQGHRNLKDSYYHYCLDFLEMVDSIIPMAPDYYHPFTLIDKKIVTGLRVPIDIGDMKPYSHNRKYRYYHGITRPEFKGTSLIKKMLAQYEREEILVTERIKFDEFIMNLKNCACYIDQVYSRTPGLSALFALKYVPYVVTGIDKKDSYNKGSPFYDFLDDCQHELIPVDLNHSLDQFEINREFLKSRHDPKKSGCILIEGAD
jgi:hypothetical protein